MPPPLSNTRYLSVSEITRSVEQAKEDDVIITTTELAAEALFASNLQPSQQPEADDVRDAIAEMILRHGSDGCVAVVAGEFGDHPETAARRMAWARGQLSNAFPQAG
ncbi:hypothetical protein [Pilimelia columellifera]|uniref:Uncharacterized protein n=1 Tax=Pilimelia columellifera subsp. columellifera TaxID=706583 RepID=A0ABN3NNZ9_9ACTN